MMQGCDGSSEPEELLRVPSLASEHGGCQGRQQSVKDAEELTSAGCKASGRARLKDCKMSCALRKAPG